MHAFFSDLIPGHISVFSLLCSMIAPLPGLPGCPLGSPSCLSEKRVGRVRVAKQDLGS